MRTGLVTAAATAVLLGACGRTASGLDAPVATTAPPTSSTTTTLATPAEPAPLHIGEKAQTRDGNSVSVLSWEQPVEGTAVEPGPGQEYGSAEAEICAGRRGAPRVSPESFAVELTDGTRRGRTYFGPREPALSGGSLAAGECVRGWLTFEVPRGQRPAYVVFKGSSQVRWLAGGRLP